MTARIAARAYDLGGRILGADSASRRCAIEVRHVHISQDDRYRRILLMNAHGLATIAASNYIVSTLRKNMRYEGPCRIFIFDNKDELSAALGGWAGHSERENDTAGSAGSLNLVHLRNFDFRGVPLIVIVSS